jgi:hypothetical protein
MSASRFLIATLSIWLCATSVFALDVPFFHSTDALAARDEWGLLTPGPLNPSDLAPRYRIRAFYYFRSGSGLLTDSAYCGALQACLRRRGYYDGPIDGVYTPDVSLALARLQKASAMRVTGTLTIPIRRALFLP